jgi:hypothetical protein
MKGYNGEDSVKMKDGSNAWLTESGNYYARREPSYDNWKSIAYYNKDTLERIQLAKAYCTECQQIIESKQCGDFVSCGCGASFVDTVGGLRNGTGLAEAPDLWMSLLRRKQWHELALFHRGILYVPYRLPHSLGHRFWPLIKRIITMTMGTKICHSCKRFVSDNEPHATCLCGDVYCGTCISILTPEELKVAIDDAAKVGHSLTFTP